MSPLKYCKLCSLKLNDFGHLLADDWSVICMNDAPRLKHWNSQLQCPGSLPAIFLGERQFPSDEKLICSMTLDIPRLICCPCEWRTKVAGILEFSALAVSCNFLYEMPDLGKEDEAGTDTVVLCIFGAKKEGKKDCSIFSCNLDLIWSHVGAGVANMATSARKSHGMSYVTRILSQYFSPQLRKNNDKTQFT